MAFSRLVLAVWIVGVGALPAVADDSAPPPVRQELLGLELSAFDLNIGNEDAAYNLAPRSPRRFEIVVGAVVRIAKHRWSNAYWTPLQLGLFLQARDGDPRAILMQTESGWIVRRGPGALELGLGVGLGAVRIPLQPEDGCDGSCILGGGTFLLAPAIRYLVTDRSRIPWGIFVRGLVPLGTADFFGVEHGTGVIVVLGFEAGIAR